MSFERRNESLDSSSGCELSFELSTTDRSHYNNMMNDDESMGANQSPVCRRNETVVVVRSSSMMLKTPDGTDGTTTIAATAAPYSPPYKRVRALRLFDSPLTPKTILHNSAATNCMMTPAVPRSRLFGGCGDKPVAVPSAYASRDDDKPAANVNPFTPNGMLLTKKRTRAIRSLANSPQICKFDLNDSDDVDTSDMELEQPTKRVALRENNISRYYQEFHELELIGCGQFGSVYKCINRLDGCVYAVKKSTKPVAGSALEKNALNEVYAHAVLGKHQHVVRYYSAWAEDNHMIIQNEYCNGGSLADRIQNEPLTVMEIRKLILHVAEGLRYIHSEGLVHLDIKPGNIFISKEKKLQFNTNYDSADDGFEDLDESNGNTSVGGGVVGGGGVNNNNSVGGGGCDEELTYKIGDLGHVTSLNNPQVEEGDSRYLPNEILHEEFGSLTKADIFAFGLTIIECLGGGPLPKNGDSWHELRAGELPQQFKQHVPIQQNRDLIALIRSMIQSDVTLRPSALQVLQHPALCVPGNKTRAQLHRELNAEKLKNEILSKQLVEAAKCIKSIAPDAAKQQQLKARFIGKKVNRSFSTTNF